MNFSFTRPKDVHQALCQERPENQHGFGGNMWEVWFLEIGDVCPRSWNWGHFGSMPCLVAVLAKPNDMGISVENMAQIPISNFRQFFLQIDSDTSSVVDHLVSEECQRTSFRESAIQKDTVSNYPRHSVMRGCLGTGRVCRFEGTKRCLSCRTLAGFANFGFQTSNFSEIIMLGSLFRSFW